MGSVEGSPVARRPTARRLGGLAWRWLACFLLWLAPSLGQLVKFLHRPGAALAAVAAAIGIAAALVWVGSQRERPRRRAPLLLLIAATLCALFAIAYPVATSGLFGRGSDRANALDVTDAALLAGRTVYEAITYLGNPPTPMPGAVRLALPFHLIGSAALQNVFWFLLLAALAPRLVGDRRGAAAYLAIFVLICPGVLMDFLTGGDFATNAVYVIVAVWALTSLARDEGWPVRFLACLLFALALSSRPIYVVEAPIAAAALLERQGLRRTLQMGAGIAALLALINVPMLADDPARFPLLLHANLLAAWPRWMHAAVVIPALSMAIACAALLVGTGRGRIWLVSALSLAPMVGPQFVHALTRFGGDRSIVISDGYTMPLALFAGLWLLRPPIREFSASAVVAIGGAAAAVGESATS